ncbi:MAG TPA: lamin tail domain-containing protein, partial [Verrucomicrobiae bacterium]
ASDLLVNGVPATEVSGVASGPYLFKFPTAGPGTVIFSFANNHGIRDLSRNENPLGVYGWTCTVNPTAPIPKVRISELNASNETGLIDEDGEQEDWIELENYGSTAVNLNGWGLTDSKSDPAQWVFPNVTINAGARLIVFASGKDRRPTTGKLHTNFLLSGNGEFLGLYDASSPRELISGVDFPEQRVDYSYGLDANGDWKYFKPSTPNAANGTSTIAGIMAPPHFSSERGFYNGPFQVYLTTDQAGADIYYTKNGGDPSGTNGVLYTDPITISSTTILRASVVKTNYLPSAPATHTYLYNITAPRRSLPALSIVTATNNLFGPTGIIGIYGGTYSGDGTWKAVNPGDYHNPDKHGLAWERPTSIEYFYPTNNDQFQIDCGIRVQGSDYIRPRYTAASKFSYRFYFRGDYGSGKLEYPVFDSVVSSFDQLVMRAGHNDDTNPFLKDELMRRMMIDCGQVGSHGAFQTLYVNGVYKGYYNLVERIEKHFCQAWHGSSLEWDVLEQNQIPLDGDNLNFAAMMTFFKNNPMTNAANYLEATRRLDLTNFVDYLLVNIYGANGDWPGNNWRAGRERSANGIWRFYLWDAEFAFGTYGQTYTYDTFANQLAETSEIPTIYKALRNSPEFKLFWADRVNKHFYNGGALADTNILRNYNTLKAQLTNIISGFDNSIASTWIPNRRKTVTNLFKTYGLAGAAGAPTFNQFGGRVPAGFQLSMTTTASGPDAKIYYTTDGSDPRVMFTGDVSAKAQLYTAPITLDSTTLIKARMWTNSAWSALTEATFEVSQFGAPLRFTEINYNPPGGDGYEFVELKNFSAVPINLSGMSFDGIDFRFPEVTVIPAGGVIVVASGASPAAFAQRYPGVVVAGRFSNSSLSDGGERVALKDKFGNIISSVDYDDERGWPTQADGKGYTLELANRELDPNSPAAWRRSKNLFGSPGVYEESAPANITINEVMPANGATPAWIELYNSGSEDVSLAKFALGDLFTSKRYVFPDAATIPAGGYYVQTGFPIGLAGGTIFLFDANTNRLDAVTLGRQLPGNSLARINGIWTLGMPTSGTENFAAALEPSTSVVINEWLANPVSGADDWLELHNKGDAPAALQGMTLSVSNAIYRIPTLTFIPPHGFVQLFATEKIGPDQLAFKLPSAGATIRLYDANGTQIDSVSYLAQTENVSEGRLPDGGATISKFRGSMSPAASNYVLSASSSLVINEVMARNVRSIIDPLGGTADWIELYNSGGAMALDGFSLSADEATAGQWTFPSGVTIPSGGYLIVWFDKTHPASVSAAGALNTGRALSAEGGGVYLFNAQGQVVDQVEYGIQAADLSIGRVGSTWSLLAVPTPGAANALPANLASSVTVHINEWSAATETAPAWVELYNSNSIPVWIGTMSLTDELNLAGQKKFVLPQLSYLGPNQFGRWITSPNKSVGAGEINFNISPLGESLRLYTSSLAIADTVS